MSKSRRNGSGIIKTWKAGIPRHGYHRDETHFSNDFIDKHCPPGRRTNVIHHPPKQRMRAVGGHTDFQVKYEDRSNVLFGQYEYLLQYNKVRARGAGHEPRRWEYNWGASQQADNYNKREAESLESRGLPTKPFIEMLLEPAKKRPLTFAQCVDFFYPMSGMIPPQVNISPFISTSVHAYYVEGFDPNKAGDLPLRLGEVSMMYGWYLAFRAILCPETAGKTAVQFLETDQKPFLSLGESRNLDSKFIHRMTTDHQQEMDLLNGISTVVGLLEQGASAAISGGVSVPTSVDELVESLEVITDVSIDDLLTEYGTAAIASVIVNVAQGEGLGGIPYTHANDLATLVLEGFMSPDKYASLLSDIDSRDKAIARAANNSHVMLDRYIKGKVKQLKIPGATDEDIADQVGFLREYYATGVPSEDLLTQYNTILERVPLGKRTPTQQIIVEGFENRQAELESLALAKAEKYLNFTKFGDTRRNPLLTTALVVSLTAAAIQGGLNYQKSKNTEDLEATREYMMNHLYKLDPRLGTGDVVFELGDHIRKGRWYDFTWPKDNNWRNSKLQPDCMLQQGGQLLNYWNHTWARVGVLVRKFAKQRVGQAQRMGTAFIAEDGTDRSIDTYDFTFANLLPSKSNGLHRTPYFCEDNSDDPACRSRDSLDPVMQDSYSFQKPNLDETNAIKKGHTRCQSLGILAKHVDDSISLVLGSIGAFSPFTHAYGFAPTFQLQPNGFLHIDGVAPRRYLGRSNFTVKDSKKRLRASIAPGHYYPRNDITRNEAYGLLGVECWAGQSPLPSRRLLESIYGQRCNLSFDVGIDSRVPVMDAQFCGLMTCLLLHREALETCRKLGYGWAERISEDRKQKFMTLITRNPQILQALAPSGSLAMADMVKGQQLTAALSPQIWKNVVQGSALNTTAMNLMKTPMVKLTPELQQSVKALTANALKGKIKIAPGALEVLKRANQSMVINRGDQQTQVAQREKLSTTQKVIGAVTVTAVTAGLSYIVYKVHKSGK